MNNKLNRLSNFELLRIISIILIIAHHYSVHGEWINKINGLNINNFIIDFLAIGGKIGVSCFILITGYFGIKSNFNFKKLIKLITQTLFYSLGFYIIFSIINHKYIAINLITTLKSFLPITFSMYWFVTTYILLYIISPYINKLINNLSTKEHIKFISILIIIGYIIPTFTTIDFNIGNILPFIILYTIGAYIKIYEDKINIKNKILVHFIILYILIFISQLVLEIISLKYNILTNKINYFIGINKIPILIASILLFLYFKNLKIQNKWINRIAETSFGIYLIHDNYFIRIYLWQILFKNNLYYNSNLLLLHALLCIILVFIICMIIERIRINFIEKNTLPYIYKYYDKLIEKIKNSKVYNKYYKMIN